MISLENVGRKPMPTHFTAEQFAASAAVGDLRTQESFGGDTHAWGPCFFALKLKHCNIAAMIIDHDTRDDTAGNSL